MAKRLSALCVAVAATAALAIIPAGPAGAAHYCGSATGTFFEVPLPANPVDPARTALYLHDRARTTGTGVPGNPLDPDDDTEGTWVFIENGEAGGYNSGGIAIVGPLNATGSADTPCGAVASADGLSATPKAGADDVII